MSYVLDTQLEGRIDRRLGYWSKSEHSPRNGRAWTKGEMVSKKISSSDRLGDSINSLRSRWLQQPWCGYAFIASYCLTSALALQIMQPRASAATLTAAMGVSTRTDLVVIILVVEGGLRPFDRQPKNCYQPLIGRAQLLFRGVDD